MKKKINKKYTAMTGWTCAQRNRLIERIDQGWLILYWCSDQHGYPANHTCDEPVQAHSGLIETVSGPLQLCSEHALHATLFPHRWKGCRVWVVALKPDFEHEKDKSGSLCREIIGEILPKYCIDPSIGVRIGRKDLSGANLSWADLSRANLSRADLSGADLAWANLSRAKRYSDDVSIPGWKLVNGSLAN